jgi:hypothetical protein
MKQERVFSFIFLAILIAVMAYWFWFLLSQSSEFSGTHAALTKSGQGHRSELE